MQWTSTVDDGGGGGELACYGYWVVKSQTWLSNWTTKPYKGFPFQSFCSKNQCSEEKSFKILVSGFLAVKIPVLTNLFKLLASVISSWWNLDVSQMPGSTVLEIHNFDIWKWRREHRLFVFYMDELSRESRQMPRRDIIQQIDHRTNETQQLIHIGNYISMLLCYTVRECSSGSTEREASTQTIVTLISQGTQTTLAVLELHSISRGKRPHGPSGGVLTDPLFKKKNSSGILRDTLEKKRCNANH